MSAEKLIDHTAEITTFPWQSVVGRFFDNATRWPDLPAVEARGIVLSYADLAARAQRLASRIGARVLAPGALVAVCLDRTVDLPAWLFAIHAAGGAYLPLDPATPQARLEQMLDDAAPALIVVSRCNASLLPRTDIPVIVAEEDERLPAVGVSVVTPDTRAYVIYTSGSTGRPKGVEIEHGSLSALIETMMRTPGLARGETMLGLTRISFDLSVAEMFLPFYVGGTLVLADLEVAATPARFVEALSHHQPDLVSATPSTWRVLIEAGWEGRPDLRLTTGGESITRDLANRLVARCAAAWNMYGPTEATVWATCYLLSDGTGPVPIGRPMDGVDVRILDADLVEAAPGTIGEIAISGTGVRRGYLNRPELTAQRFVRPGGGPLTYLTGDLGRIGEDGLIYCLGRADDQVKVRGFRIELGDVEAALSAHPAVAFCSVRVWPDRSGDPALIGYVVRRDDCQATAADVRVFLASLLPHYMIPARFMFIAQIPLTANSKTDRAALPDPFVREDAAGNAASDKSTEATLAAIWRELLGVAAVLPDDDFFELGGYSLMTVRLLRRIDAEFGRRLTPIDLMRSSTLAGMAHLISSEESTSAAEPMLLNAGGARPAFHWLDAGPLMRTLTRYLSTDQPAYALNLDVSDEAALDGGTVEIAAIAARLRTRLLAAQSDGPYYIGGWCRWGIVAYELACQLRDGGREVALLVLLDADRPGHRDWRQHVRLRVRRWMRPAPQPPDATADRSFSQKVEIAARSFVPRPLDVQVLLVRPRNCAGNSGWRQSLGDHLQTERMSGDHVSMVRMPHVVELAAVIDRHLFRTQRSG